MRTFAFLLLALLSTLAAAAQTPSAPPAATVIAPYELTISTQYTTVLKFPARVLRGAIGSPDVVAEKESEAPYILKIKAATANFTPTNLHVFTDDARVHVFNLRYASVPEPATFDLSQVERTNPLTGIPNVYQLAALAGIVKKNPAFLQKQTSHAKMQLTLHGIYAVGDVLMFQLSLINHATLPFDIDFVRCTMMDKKKAKRTSVQQQQLEIIYQDAPASLPGTSGVRFVVTIKRLTITDQKKFLIEVGEATGGRNLSLAVKNKHLLQAKTL